VAFYARGSVGPEVSQIQARLQELGLYAGTVDGIFGGGTESAVKAFQTRESLSPDGVVGDGTWQRLFPAAGSIPPPALASRSLQEKVLTLTGSFETSQPPPECFAAVSGDFDGQGISFGALQWNLGQKTLQPLLIAVRDKHPAVWKTVFHTFAPVIGAVLNGSLDEQLRWAASIQTPRKQLIEPWRGLFKTLGRTRECQEAQLMSADAYLRKAARLCETYGVSSQRAFALLFDICVQNGGISDVVRAQIERDFKAISATAAAEVEVAKLRIIARRRAEASNPRWVHDVMTRKMTIADGRGTVHGRAYNLEAQFGITLASMQEPRSRGRSTPWWFDLLPPVSTRGRRPRRRKLTRPGKRGR